MFDPIIYDMPEIGMLRNRVPVLWLNPGVSPVLDVMPFLDLDMENIEDADALMKRFGPVLAELFPELGPFGGIIESPLIPVPAMKSRLAPSVGRRQKGSLLVKADHQLPVAGSVKARGGIYEVLCFAETTARDQGIFSDKDPYKRFLDGDVREVLGRYTVTVGSTGNLGLSIGIMAASLGFNAVVHMSVEAKEWKKRLLRDRGVDVVEHASDYSSAVKAGRDASAGNPRMYFVDDEKSILLFLGYSVAALRLRDQLSEQDISVDGDHPLYVYIPCGVGGAPSGIIFGLKNIFGDHVHCFIAEPVESPSMLMGLLTGFEDDISVYDIGLTNRTIADGLAVGSPSRLAGRMIKHLITGCCTVTDDELLKYLLMLYESEGMAIEPSAAAGFRAYVSVAGRTDLPPFNKKNEENATHIVWTTGGGLVPADEFERFISEAHEKNKF